MVMTVQATWPGGERRLRALVDTGSATPLVVRRDVFSETELSKATWPVTFLTASGQVLPGGSSGIKLQLSLVVIVDGRERLSIAGGVVKLPVPSEQDVKTIGVVRPDLGV